MNWADLYSAPASGPAIQTVATGPTGPNQTIVTGGGQMSGNAASAAPAAISWLGMGLALIALRLLIAFGGRVA